MADPTATASAAAASSSSETTPQQSIVDRFFRQLEQKFELQRLEVEETLHREMLLLREEQHQQLATLYEPIRRQQHEQPDPSQVTQLQQVMRDHETQRTQMETRHALILDVLAHEQHEKTQQMRRDCISLLDSDPNADPQSLTAMLQTLDLNRS